MYSKKKFEIIIVGDVFLQTKSGTLSPFTSEIETLFKTNSCVLINLETVLMDDGQSQEKAVSIHSDPRLVYYLQETGINVVNLANNHTFDYGIEGLQSTISTLASAGIDHIGTLQQGAQKPFLFQNHGYHCGMLGYTIGIGSLQNSDTSVAPLDEQRIIHDIHNLKSKNIEKIIINLHWGEEYVAYPSPEQQRLARNLIDFGADVILGHHPHVVQGIEVYNDGVIFYSLGNFNFMNSRSLDQCFPSTQWGLIALLNFPEKQAVDYRIIPVQIDNEYRPHFAPKDEEAAFLKYIQEISEPLLPQIKKLFWFKEAAWPHFRNNMPSFFQRIKKYGVSHLYQMLRWIISPDNFGFYLGLIFVLIAKIFRQPVPKAACPKPK